MTTARSLASAVIFRHPSYFETGRALVRRAEVLDHLRRGPDREAIRRHRLRHDRVRPDDCPLADISDDHRLGEHECSRTEADRPEVVALTEKVRVRVAEPVVA